MDFKTEANIIRALAELSKNGHLHKGAGRRTGALTVVPRWRKRKLNITTKRRRLSTWRSAVDRDAVKAGVSGPSLAFSDHHAVDTTGLSAPPWRRT